MIDKEQEKRNMHRMHARNNIKKYDEESQGISDVKDKNQKIDEIIDDVKLEAEESDDDFVKKIMMRKGSGGLANLDDLNDKYGAGKR